MPLNRRNQTKSNLRTYTEICYAYTHIHIDILTHKCYAYTHIHIDILTHKCYAYTHIHIDILTHKCYAYTHIHIDILTHMLCLHAYSYRHTHTNIMPIRIHTHIDLSTSWRIWIIAPWYVHLLAEGLLVSRQNHILYTIRNQLMKKALFLFSFFGGAIRNSFEDSD